MATLPSLTKTYSTLRNIPLPNISTDLLAFKSCLWALKEAMLGLRTAGGTQGGTRTSQSLWTVVSCSDGSSVSNTDLWGSTFDDSKIVINSNGSAHSWIVLQNTALGYQFIIDANTSAPQYSRLATTLISQPFDTGTTTSSPSNSTYEFDARNSSVGNSTNVFGLFAGNVANNLAGGNPIYLHYTANATDGQFYALISKQNSGIFMSALALIKTTSQNISDTNNVFLLASDFNSSRGAWSDTGGSGQYNTTCRLPTGALMTAGGWGPTPVYGGAAYQSTTDDRGTDFFTSNYNAYQAEMQSFSPIAVYRGIIPDLYITGGGVIGSAIPSPAACERTIVGSTIVPFIGGPPII